MSIKHSVGDKDNKGRKAANHPRDVAIVRQLLNFQLAYNRVYFNGKLNGIPFLPADGYGNMDSTIEAIRAYQLLILKLPGMVGLIEPNDQTIRALIGTTTMMAGFHKEAEMKAANKALAQHKLRQAYYSDELEYMDLTGETKCLIEVLRRPDVDDRYIPSTPGVTSAFHQNLAYIANAPPNSPPLPVDQVASRLLSFIENNCREKTTRQFIQLIINKQVEIERALNQFRHTDEWTRVSFADNGRTKGPGAAYRNLMIWFINKKLDQRSIYSCVGNSIDVTQ